MKTITLFIAYLTFLSVFASATTSTPDHLQPLGLLSSDESALYNSLIRSDERQLILWMVANPALSKTHAVVLDAKVEFEQDGPDSAKFKSCQCFLSDVWVNPQLPYEPSQKYRPSPPEYIDRRQIPIDEEFANLMEEAWKSVLRQTRYADKAQMFLDGKFYIFGSGRFCAAAVSPNTGTPLMLVELANQLGMLVQAEETDREPIRKKCIELAKSIIEKTNPNQKLDPTVKTPVESGNEQGTAGQL